MGWADEKNFVARENKEMTIEHVETLFRKRREEFQVVYTVLVWLPDIQFERHSESPRSKFFSPVVQFLPLSRVRFRMMTI